MTYDVQCDIWYHDKSLVVASFLYTNQ